MVLLHRITPFSIGLVIALGFAAMTVFGVHPAIACSVTFFIVALLLARLVGGSPRSFQFWYFVGTPLLFLLASDGLLLFLEHPSARTGLAILTALLVFLFAEQLFSYVHTPAAYQPYSIEHLSLGLNVLTIFFLSSVAFGLRLFLHLSIPALAGVFLLTAFFAMYGTLWVGKVEHRAAWPYALAGAILATELFTVITFLPTGFYTNAALITLFVYLFLGLSRARFMDKLTKPVVQRYVAIGVVLFGAIIGTARWI